MKKFFLTFTMISIISFSNAQYDITDFASNNLSFFSIDNLSEYLHYSSNFSNTVAEALHTVDLSSVSGPDTIFFPVSIDNEIVPLTGLNTTQDTLTIEIAVGYWGNNNSAIRTNNADFTVKNSFNSYDYIDQSRNQRGASALYDEFKFLEGETDTLMVIVTDGIFSLDYLSIRSSNATVVTNTNEGLFDENRASITNPVFNGELTISLPSDISETTVELIAMDGQIMGAKQFSKSDNTMDVSALKGLYLLREVSTGSFKKIIIK